MTKHQNVRVYFSESDGKFWLKRFLKPGFSHCFIAIEGVIIDPSFHFGQVFKDEGLYEATTYIDVEITEPEHAKRTIWQVFTCVSVVKYFLGINQYTMWTPYQLYQHLKLLRKFQDGQQEKT